MPLAVLEFHFRRIAVGLVAARFGRLIGHVPRRVELLVQLRFKARRMMMVPGRRDAWVMLVILRYRIGCGCLQGEETDDEGTRK
jgi:hypothetical protein